MIWLVFALGLLVGFLVGIVSGDALDLYRASRKDRPMSPSNTGWKRGLPVVALVVTVALNVVVGLLLILTRESTARYTECSADWQQQFGTAYRARLDASIDVGTAMDGVLMAVDSNDPSSFNTAVDRYVALRQAQDRERRANPLPPLPETLCGTPSEIRR